MDNLPAELISQIAALCDYKTKLQFCIVNRYLREVVSPLACTYTNGQKGNSIHVVATWSFTWIEFTRLLYLFLSKTFANPFAHYFKSNISMSDGT
jgi:hypothetical protein